MTESTVVLKPLKRNPEYQMWKGMKARCSNPNHVKWKDYGGRGITVCEAWRNSFIAFIYDMGSRPSDRHEIERIENALGYSKENCRWVTRPEQMQNTRVTVLNAELVRQVRKLYAEGKATIAQLARAHGIKETTMDHAVRRLSWKNIA